MSNARKNTLKKLSFLGFGKRGNNSSPDSASNDGEVQLDEEITKVFTMEKDSADAFDVSRLHDTADSSYPKQFGEQDYFQHRHMHVPHKGSSKSMRRRTSHQQPTTSQMPTDTSVESPSSTDTAELPLLSSASLRTDDSHSDHLQRELSSQVLQEASDEEVGNSSESECVLSDPSGYRGPLEEDLSPDKKVQFEGKYQEEADGHKSAIKHSRHHHALHSKFRKYSLQEDPSQHKKKEKSGESSSHNKQRRISTQPEDLPLRGVDRDQLDSHRSDDARALRRYKTSRPSVVHIGRKENGDQLPPAFLKKMYDHSPHAIFVELDELHTEPDEREWKETARWIKYEEDVEEGVDRWGKPHVASLSFHSLLNLRKCLEDGLVCLDLEEKDLPAIAYRVTEDLYREDLIREEDKAKIMRVLLLRHRHVNEHHDRGFRFTKKHSYTSLQNLHDPDKRKISFSLPPSSMKNGVRTDSDGKLVLHDSQTIVDMKEEVYSASNEDIRRGHNDTILKRIPADAQGSSILVGEVDFLEQPAIAFVRLAEGILIPSLIEVNIPVRFIFILLGPKKASVDYHEVGRSISTLMANQQFLNIAYKADNRKALLSAINEFLDDSIVLPPGDWERQALLPIEEIKAKSEQIRKRKENALAGKKKTDAEITKALLAADGGGDKKPPFPNPLERTKRPFGGLINDLKRRIPYFKRDILDGLNAQCAAAAIFMYFACVSGAIGFGGLTDIKTENWMGISETLVCTSVAGIIFALFSGQPIIIIGNTGPLLLFDESLYQFCKANDIEFLTTRVYIGLWLAVIALVVACLEGSVFVKLFSRFTEDIFSALIVVMYIVESIMTIIFEFGRHPLLDDYCDKTFVPFSDINETTDGNETFYGLTEKQAVTPLPSVDAHGIINQPNTALLCTCLALGTFTIAYYLKMFRNSQFLGRSARRTLGDFGVPIAIVIMVFVDYSFPQVYTEKLNVPSGFAPSNPEERGWFINPGGDKKPIPLWIVFASAIPAMLVYILLFMETHICELIMDKKERKLKKGGGIHLDIVIISCINVINGFFGLPWVCAATVRSIAHIASLTVMSRTHAPGEKPHVIEVKEQRISALVVSILVGLSVLMSPLLKLVPMAVLYGFFLYLGIASIDGIQFFDRIKLLFMPVKHHPQACYVRKVRTAKMHLFTLIQLMCLVILWIVKSTKASLAFPFFLLLMIPLRAHLTCLFSVQELRALDGDQPDVDDDEPDFYAEAPLPG